MAVTSIHPIRATVSTAIRYIVNGDKTVNGLYVSSYFCRADSRGAAEDFSRVRKQGTGRTEVLAHHIIQSFKPDEITPEKAFAVGEELCEKFLKGSYQYVLAVHTDHEHIHCLYALLYAGKENDDENSYLTPEQALQAAEEANGRVHNTAEETAVTTAYEDNAESTEETEQTEQTSSNNTPYIIISVIAVMDIGAAAFFLIKKKTKNKSAEADEEEEINFYDNEEE